MGGPRGPPPPPPGHGSAGPPPPGGYPFFAKKIQFSRKITVKRNVFSRSGVFFCISRGAGAPTPSAHGAPAGSGPRGRHGPPRNDWTSSRKDRTSAISRKSLLSATFLSIFLIFMHFGGGGGGGGARRRAKEGGRQLRAIRAPFTRHSRAIHASFFTRPGGMCKGGGAINYFGVFSRKSLLNATFSSNFAILRTPRARRPPYKKRHPVQFSSLPRPPPL